MAEKTGRSHATSAARIQPSYLVDQMLSALQAALKKGDYQPGDKLPAEAKLATEFGVGRSTVREALRVLSHLGLVETWSGKGTFVVHSRAPEIHVSEEMQLDDIQDIYDFRYALEMEAAERAALRRNDKQLGNLKSLMSDAKSALGRGDIDVAIRADTDFHIAILEAAGCKFAASVYRNNRSRIDMAAKAIIDMATADATSRSLVEVQAIHDDLIDAIERQDAHAALVAVRRDQREVHAWLRMQINEYEASKP